MRKQLPFLVVLILTTMSASSQRPLIAASRHSAVRLVYRIPADTALKYYQHGQLTGLALDPAAAVASWPSDTAMFDDLAVGHYAIVEAKGINLQIQLYNKTKLRAFLSNGTRNIYLDIFQGLTRVTDAVVRIGTREYAGQSGSYKLPPSTKEDFLISVIVPGDTMIAELNQERDYGSGWNQLTSHFFNTKVGATIAWPYRKLKSVFDGPVYYNRPTRRAYRTARGYIVFNKPKYLPGDTVRYKAYLLNKRGRRVKQTIYPHLTYQKNNQTVIQALPPLRPVSPGAFVSDLILTDSLPTDTRYSLVFKARKNRHLLTGYFNTEDYLLDEAATFTFRANRKLYQRGDTIFLYASARDANGLSILDERIELNVLSSAVDKIYANRVFIMDTLWQNELPLSGDGETLIKIPTNGFPDALMDISVKAVFRNSNNELHEREVKVTYDAARSLISVRQDNGFITAEYFHNGVSVPHSGTMDLDDEEDIPITFPYRARIDAFVSDYWFYAEDSTGDAVVELHEVEDPAAPVYNLDRSGFTISNPDSLTIRYVISKGNRVVAEGIDSSALVSWSHDMTRNVQYQVEWTYFSKGRAMKFVNGTQLLDKILQTTITSKEVVYPGQSDTIAVAIKDYKGRAASGVNLTAVSYSGQFGNAHVAEPVAKWKSKRKYQRKWPEYSMENVTMPAAAIPGLLPKWRRALGLDTMDFYKLLLPGKPLRMIVTPVHDQPAQLAVHLVKKGMPQQIYMLYINRNLRYVSAATRQPVYSYATWPGYTQIGIRTKDAYIQIDSIYLQPFYKYDISFDLDSLPHNAIILPRKSYYEPYEIASINGAMMRFENTRQFPYGTLRQQGLEVDPGSGSLEVLGPFLSGDSIFAISQGNYQLNFPFEPYHSYRVSEKMVRLEKWQLLYDYERGHPRLRPWGDPYRVGDTLMKPTVFVKDVFVSTPAVVLPDPTYNPRGIGGSGALKIFIDADSIVRWVLVSQDSVHSFRVNGYKGYTFNGIMPGKYMLLLITQNLKLAKIHDVDIRANASLNIKIDSLDFTEDDKIINQIIADQRSLRMPLKTTEDPRILDRPSLGLPLLPGSATLTGRIIDAKGKLPVAYAVVAVAGYQKLTAALADGSYTLTGLPTGRYIIEISAVGYEAKKIAVEFNGNGILNAELIPYEGSLNEVVVVGYSTTRRKQVTGSISTVSADQLGVALQGRAAGIHVVVRGSSTVAGSGKPIYVVDGVLMDELPAGTAGSGNITVLRSETAVALYGSRASNGAIVISTNAPANQLRSRFSDYALWAPNVMTNKKGEALIPVTYPDNITSWNTTIVGMDKKGRITKSSTVTKSVKQLLAQLSAPRFLVEGDSAIAIGRVTNYSTTSLNLNVAAEGNGVAKISTRRSVAANEAGIEELLLQPASSDTMKVSFSVLTDEGLGDGEKRMIPVIKKSISESRGNFWIMLADTTVHFEPVTSGGEVTIQAQANSLDVLIDELDKLYLYPWYCLEQSASKLTGLESERKIRQALGQRFDRENDRRNLISSIQKAQSFDGSWGWWPGNKGNFFVTNYVTRALVLVKDEPFVKDNLRNAALYIQQQLPHLRGAYLTEALYTLSQVGHEMDYGSEINRLRIDSLGLHQQWQLVATLKARQLPYNPILERLLRKKQEMMTGGVYWGSDDKDWIANDMATTVLAFRVLQQIPEHRALLDGMLQFFMHRRKRGQWMNTVESAQVTATLMPFLLAQQSQPLQPTTLTINGKQIAIDSKKPLKTTVSPAGTITITKRNGDLIYVGVSQQVEILDPKVVDQHFKVSSQFQNQGQTAPALKGGEKLVMEVVVEATEDAEYVMITIPIPAGCTYNEKDQAVSKNIHKQFFKDKVVIFAEDLTKGKHQFDLKLEARYTGGYHVKPAVAELMYFPVFFGRNAPSYLIVNK